jgi:predicted  nucleic acid-binding Zn-ribbon protein
MAQLQKTKDDLTGVSQQFDEALAAAKTAVENHTAFAAGLAAKMPKKK